MHSKSKPFARAIMLTAVVCFSACNRGSTPTLQPIVEQEHPELRGKFVWHNLITPDPEAARRFYGGLFGWEFDLLDGGRYTEVSYQGRNLGGIVDGRVLETPPRSSVWLGAISVAQVDDALERAVTAGAQTLLATTNIPKVGRVASISDPQGAVVQLITASRGDPPDAAPPVHTWLWHELIANDPSEAAEFYRSVVGYEVERLGSADTDEYRVLRSESKPRAGILENPFEDTRPAWIPYVRVASLEGLMARVVELGGSVVIAPRDDLRDGTLALVRDPSGAPVALQTWTPETGGEG